MADKTYTGEEFKNLHPNIDFYILTSKNECDDIKTGLCQFGDDNNNYFVPKENVGLNIGKEKKYMFWIRKVEIPDDAFVTSIVKTSSNEIVFLADKLVLGERETIRSKQDLFETMVTKNGDALRYVSNKFLF